MEDIVRSQFNQIIAKHYERLTGSKNAPGGLPLTLDNIACFILFGGRELEMSDYTSEVSERYTMDEFLQEIKDTGIENDEHFQAAMQDMMQKKYIEHLPDGHIHSYQDTKDAARMLNRIFPKMQGLNLLAYIWQTVAEAASGRTDLESAFSRFDQTLEMHGVLPPKPKIPVITSSPKPQAQQPQHQAPPQPPAKEKKEFGQSPRSRLIIRDYVVADAPAKATPAAKKPVAPAPVDSKEDIARDGETAKKEAAAEIDQKILDETAAMKQKIAELEKTIAATEKEKLASPPESAQPVKKEEPIEAPVASAEETGIQVDDEIAKKIAAFEKELALVCPICKTGVLQEKTTAAGKVFYACEAEHCNFISWGRPHNIQCTRCKNPFLVEITDAAGQIILRCPRATCQHRQPLSSGSAGTKVVRKRLVRRKQ
jgi:ssDNA-binding Zn-finger/Zn-ribbon topoisomerase 1